MILVVKIYNNDVNYKKFRPIMLITKNYKYIHINIFIIICLTHIIY
jgi:hypothetical protein